MKQTRKIILIMTDTQRWDMLGCYGNQTLKTPNLDRLASEGMRFERAYTTQPVCGPARSAIFTGQFPHSNGSWSNCMPLGDNVKTIGQRLRDNGLHTAYIGKWHLDGSDYFGMGRCPDGWDKTYWYDMRNYLEELPEGERRRSRTPQIMEDGGIDETFTYAHRCSERAVKFLQTCNEEDFFLVVSYDEPHHPYVCPEPFASMYKGYEFPKSKNVWDNLEGKPEHQRAWAGGEVLGDKEHLKITNDYYFGCNSYVDYEIGRVLDAIDTFAPDALVIYTSDHGDALHSHSLRGKGAAMYDEICRIPFLAKWPGTIKSGSVCGSAISHIDIAPTIFEAAGIGMPKIFEGKSMCRALINPDEKINDRVYIEFSRYEMDHDNFGGFQPVRAAFDGRYKLVINLLATDELYDLEKDPEEIVNLIDSSSHAEIRDSLHDGLLAWMNESRDPFRGYCWERRPWRNDARPASWGYTGMTRQRENEEYEPRQLDYRTGVEMTEAVRNNLK